MDEDCRSYWCVFCLRELPIEIVDEEGNGVIVHDDKPHMNFAFDDMAAPQ